MRKDPPFDDAYLWATLLLEHARGRTLLINDPRGLRDANEKIYATYFPELMTDTMVTSDKARIKAFLARLKTRGVLKPLSGAGGEGIFALDPSDPNLNAIIETVTRGGRQLAMVQRYLPAVRQGDKRIILVDGKVAGALNRVPAEGEARANMHVGGRAEKSTLTHREQEICEAIGPALKQRGLIFVGIDVIGDYLTEINVTSPTGIQEIDRFDNVSIEGQIWDVIEERVAENRGSVV